MIQRYRKKPVVIETIQWDGTRDCAEKIINWIETVSEYTAEYYPERTGYKRLEDKTLLPVQYEAELEIETLEGYIVAYAGWWIIRGIEGEFYPCKDSIFKETYEPEE